MELIVVRHLAGSSDSTPQQQLRDLTEVLDLYAPVDESADQPQSITNPGDPDATTGLEPEEPLAVRVDEMSDTMREAWRRLRGSAGFRPELFRAWEQSGDQPFPTLRIHDDELLFEIEPDALLDGLPVDEHGAVVFSDQTMQRRENSEALSRKGRSAGDDEMTVETPQAQYYYRIDGTAMLSRSRYLHLDLDIELREPLYDTLEQNTESFAGGATDPMVAVIANTGETRGNEFEADALMVRRTGPAASATAFRIHDIAQRRQVKTEQMEYFDGPVIGILALVTGFDVFPTENTESTGTTDSLENAEPAE